MDENTNIKYQIKKVETLKEGEKYRIQIRLPMSLGWIDHMNLMIGKHDKYYAIPIPYQKKENNMVYFETELELPTSALYHYYFSFTANERTMVLSKKGLKNENYISKEDMEKLSVNFKVPDWAKGKIMYHIFVDRFAKARKEELPKMKNRNVYTNWNEEMQIGPDQNGIWNADFYGGDLQGIIQKLEYIKSLGVSILYLSPIVWSQSNHRYDTADYELVDPYAGTNHDLKELCDRAHQMGMKVILDAVFNHTGNDSKYFNEYGTFKELGAYQSKDSQYYSFYRKYIRNNQTFFDYWWGMKNLPVCDGYSKDWQNYIYGEGGVIDLWFSLGIDGLRLDVADELTDEFIEGITTAVKRNKEDGLVLGEVWKNPMRMNREYLENGKTMHTVMNYPLMDALIRYYKYADVNKLGDVLYQLQTEYPEDTLYSLMNFTSTHDITRAINIFATNEFQPYGEWAWNLKNDNRDWQKEYKISEEQYNIGKKMYKSYLYNLTFFPGILSIFYGDEAGLQGMGNLANRKPYPWGNEDQDLVTFFQKLGKIRQQEPFLNTAKLDITDVNYQYLQYRRMGEKEEALITVNRTNEPILIHTPKTYEEVDKIYTLGNSSPKKLDSYGGITLKKTRKNG